MSGFDPGDGGGSRMEGLEAYHRAGDPLDETMVLLKNVVQVFDLPDLDDAAAAGEFQDRVYRLQAGEIGAALVDDNSVWHSVCADGSL